MCAYIYETVQHDGENRIKLFTTAIDYSGFHWHYDYEFILVLKGQLVVNESADEFVLEKGDFILINSQTVHALRRLHGDNLCLFLQISEKMFADLRRGFFYFYLNSQDGKKTPRNGYASYRRLLAGAGYESLAGRPNRYRISAYVCSLLADLIDYSVYDLYQRSGPPSASDVELFMQIIDYLQENCCTPSVISDIQKKLGIGEKTLYRFMKKYTGKSPKQFVLEHRISIAADMLRSTNLSIPYIASQCGFNAENTFYRAFRNEVGVTPGEYQKKSIERSLKLDVKGYLPYHYDEAKQLLRKYANEV